MLTRCTTLGDLIAIWLPLYGLCVPTADLYMELCLLLLLLQKPRCPSARSTVGIEPAIETSVSKNVIDYSNYSAHPA